MTLHIHTLKGCTPTPLAHYLKALGILRLVSEQKDENVRGWWENDVFNIATALSSEELMNFFLYEYCPTPITSPWNGRSGYYEKGGKAAKEALGVIENTQASRFENYRNLIKAIKELVYKKKPSNENEKSKLIITIKNKINNDFLSWVNTAVVISKSRKMLFPSILGSGGNEGSMDFSSNFMQNLIKIFDVTSEDNVPSLTSKYDLNTSIFGGEKRAFNNTNCSMMSHAPGLSLLNAWDFVLSFEGTIISCPSSYKISSNNGKSVLVSPFCVSHNGVAVTSGCEKDIQPRKKQQEGEPRGEQWFPLWNNPTKYLSLVDLYREARAQIGKKEAANPTDFARSIGRLGFSRGISDFIRFGYLSRVGNHKFNIACELGKWRVQLHPNQNLLDEITFWVDNLRGICKSKNVPSRLCRAIHNCDEGIMNCCRNGTDKRRWLRLLNALGEAETALVKTPKTATDPPKRICPLPPISPQWIQAADTGEPELRLALAFASQGTTNEQSNPDWSSIIRHHLVPLDKTLRKFAPLSDSRAWKNELVAKTDFEKTAKAVVQRRLLFKKKSEPFPLGPLGDIGVRLEDLQAFFEHETDDNLIKNLIRPLMAVRKQFIPRWRFIDSNVVAAGELSIFGLLKLCHLPWPIPLGKCGITVRTDPSIFARLEAGDLTQAVAIALRRLRASGLRPHIITALGTPRQSRRLAAALAFPITPQQAKMFAMSLTKPTIESSGEFLKQKD
ncbi:type I-G CRISPR-associated protein Cas8g1/Csx17 [Desulfoplanes sp.]